MNNGWRDIDIHGCNSLVKIGFAPICACSDNWRIWHHNNSISRSRDVTDQLRWRHNAQSEKTALGNYGEMSARWYFLADLCVHYTIKRVRNKIIHSLPWITIFVTREAIRQWFSLVTSSLVKIIAESPHSWQKKSLFTVTHALFFICFILVAINHILIFVYCFLSIWYSQITNTSMNSQIPQCACSISHNALFRT